MTATAIHSYHIQGPEDHFRTFFYLIIFQPLSYHLVISNYFNPLQPPSTSLKNAPRNLPSHQIIRQLYRCRRSFFLSEGRGGIWFPGAKWSGEIDNDSRDPFLDPANKRKLEIIVVGTGLAGSSAAASLGEMGYKVKAFCFQDSPRRAHSIAAQGGINAAKNYQNDGDSVYRLFYDTIKGGDYRAREGNVHRLAEVSTSIIDQ